MIKKIKGNIFNTSAQVIVNTVNCVGVMGRGIALECKLRYPEMFKKYKNFCDLKKIEPGVLQIWKESHPWILKFPTSWSRLPRPSSIQPSSRRTSIFFALVL